MQDAEDLRGGSLRPEMVGRTDRDRLDWLMPILQLSDEPGDARAILLAGSILQRKSGRRAIDDAMDAEKP